MPKIPGRASARAAPVYVALSALEGVLASLDEHGIATNLDEGALGEFSASTRRQILAGLRFLRLIDRNGRVRASLRKLARAHGTSAWPSVLAEVMEVAYEPLLEHSLQTMSAEEFQDAFSKTYPSTSGLTRKSITFFLSAARAAQLPVGPHLFDGRRVRRRAPPTIPKPTEGNPMVETEGTESGTGRAGESTGHSNGTRPGDAETIFLTNLLDQDAMSDTEQEAIWILLKYVRRGRGARL